MKTRPVFISVVLFVIIHFVFSTAEAKSKNAKDKNFQGNPEIVIPVNSPVYLVVKGVFPTEKKAEDTRKFIQQLLVNTPADGIIESKKLEGFPPNQWIVASAFDNEQKAKWWMEFGDRNKTLPKPYIKKTALLEETMQIPYFPDAVRENFHRFYTEEEIIQRVSQFPDIQDLKRKESLKFLFTKYPRTGDYSYEVEVLKERAGAAPLAYDFISMSAVDLGHYSRFVEGLKAKK